MPTFRELNLNPIMDYNYYAAFPGITLEEMGYLQQATAGLSEDQHRTFIYLYSSKRRSAQDILLFSLLGFIGIAGIQRFVTGRIGLGIIYLITFGFFYIGTIVDLINHKSLANDYNTDMIYETMQMVGMGGGKL
jgi:TM2 domain-containing membrane protein YozV